jgi:hypothetical protein
MEKYHGNTVEYWKQNAEEDYIKTPISVLKYITVLEEQAEQLRKHAVVGRSEQFVCDHNLMPKQPSDATDYCVCTKCGRYIKEN